MVFGVPGVEACFAGYGQGRRRAVAGAVPDGLKDGLDGHHVVFVVAGVEACPAGYGQGWRRAVAGAVPRGSKDGLAGHDGMEGRAGVREQFPWVGVPTLSRQRIQGQALPIQASRDVFLSAVQPQEGWTRARHALAARSRLPGGRPLWIWQSCVQLGHWLVDLRELQRQRLL